MNRIGKALPYIGVTGFTTRAQVDAALEAVPADAPPRSFMVGVLTSQKVLTGGERNARSPAPGDIASIFSPDPRCLNLVHYFSPTPATHQYLERLFDVAGPLFHGFQFNGEWPYRGALHGVRETWNALMNPWPLRIVLQAKPAAHTDGMQGGWAPSPMHFDGYISDILLDASGGGGVPLDVAVTRAAVDKVHSSWGRFGLCCPLIAIAGGLCAETLPEVLSMVREHGLSIDAEGKLFTGNDLDMDKVHAYLRAAFGART